MVQKDAHALREDFPATGARTQRRALFTSCRDGDRQCDQPRHQAAGRMGRAAEVPVQDDANDVKVVVERPRRKTAELASHYRRQFTEPHPSDSSGRSLPRSLTRTGEWLKLPCAVQQRKGVTRNHELLVRADDHCRCGAVVGRDARCPVRIELLIEPQPYPSEPRSDARTHACGVFTDACGKDEAVDSAERRGEGSGAQGDTISRSVLYEQRRKAHMTQGRACRVDQRRSSKV